MRPSSCEDLIFQPNQHVPSQSIAHVFVRMIEVGLGHSHQSVKQFRDSPLLLTKSSLNEVQTAEKKQESRSSRETS